MKHLLIIYSLVFLILLWGSATHAADDIDFDSLVPAEQIAAELGQNKPIEKQSEDEKAFFHRHYPWIYPAPYPYPVYNPYYYPPPYRPVGVVCYASDAFGVTWSAFSYNVYEAQNLALTQCLSLSNRGCYSRGCNYQ